MDRPLPPLSPDDKMYAGLCYIFWFVVPVFLYNSRRSEDHFIMFSCIQGAFLGLVMTFLSFLVVILVTIGSKVLVTVTQSYYVFSGFVGMGVAVLMMCYFFGVVGLHCFWGWRAYHGEYFEVSKVGAWAWEKTLELNGTLPSADSIPSLRSSMGGQDPDEVFQSMGVDPVGGKSSFEASREVKKVSWNKVSSSSSPGKVPEVFQKKASSAPPSVSEDRTKNVRRWKPPSV